MVIGMQPLLCALFIVLLLSTPAMAAPNPFPVDPMPTAPLIPTTPTIGFSQSEADVTEGQAPARITIVLSQATSNQVSVFYRVSGTAGAGGDYQLQNGVITFAPGQTTNTLVIPVTDDTKTEGDETVMITLTEPQNAMLGQSIFTLTIRDNDQAKGS